MTLKETFSKPLPDGKIYELTQPHSDERFDEYERKISESVKLNNLCEEIFESDYPSANTNICTLGDPFPCATQASLLDSNLFAHMDIAIRNAYAPEGKIVRDSFSGYSLKGYSDKELADLDQLIKAFLEEHQELSKKHLEAMWFGVKLIRCQKFSGNINNSWITINAGRYRLLRHIHGKLPNGREEYIMKNRLAYDTECNKVPVVTGTTLPEQWKLTDKLIGGGFNRGEFVGFVAPPSNNPPKTNFAIRAMAQLQSEERKNLYVHTNDAESTMSKDLLDKYFNDLVKTPKVEIMEQTVQELKETENVNPVVIDSLDQLSSKEQKRLRKKKKKPKHVTNCKSRMMKMVMGTTILSKLGSIQSKTQENLARQILDKHTLSSYTEAVTGEKLPEYQKRLLDIKQQRHIQEAIDLEANVTDEGDPQLVESKH